MLILMYEYVKLLWLLDLQLEDNKESVLLEHLDQTENKYLRTVDL